MFKTYAQMTPAERLTDRIAKNRQIEANIKPVQAAQQREATRRFNRNVTRATLNLHNALINLDGVGLPAETLSNCLGWSHPPTSASTYTPEEEAAANYAYDRLAK